MSHLYYTTPVLYHTCLQHTCGTHQLRYITPILNNTFYTTPVLYHTCVVPHVCYTMRVLYHICVIPHVFIPCMFHITLVYTYHISQLVCDTLYYTTPILYITYGMPRVWYITTVLYHICVIPHLCYTTLCYTTLCYTTYAISHLCYTTPM